MKAVFVRIIEQRTDYLYEAFMNISWQIWLSWQPFVKNSNDISYETTGPILMKFYSYH